LTARIGEALHERRRNPFLHQKAIGRGARLSAVAHLRNHRAGDRGFDIRVIEHEERRIAAELHGTADDAIGRLRQQHAPDLGRPRERKFAHARIVQHRTDDLAGARGRNDVDDPCRCAGLLQNRADCKCCQRRI
jgi:hypothetical protein